MKSAWALLLSLVASPVLAEPPRRALVDTFGGSINNLGLQQTLEASWTWGLSRSSHPLLRDSHVALGVTNSVSPAYLRVAGWAAYAPLSVLEVRAGVEPVYYFGVVGSLIGFPSQRSVFDEDARRVLRRDATSGIGARLFVAPTLRLRVGRGMASSTLDVERWNVSGPGLYFYEPWRDTLLHSDHGDTIFRTSSVVLWEHGDATGRRLLAGVHHEFMRVRDAPWNDMQRVGPLAIWTLGESRFGLDHPTVIANLYYYLEDPYKRHEPGATIGLRFGLR